MGNEYEWDQKLIQKQKMGMLVFVLCQWVQVRAQVLDVQTKNLAQPDLLCLSST